MQTATREEASLGVEGTSLHQIRGFQMTMPDSQADGLSAGQVPTGMQGHMPHAGAGMLLCPGAP